MLSDVAIVPALGVVLVQNFYHGILPPPRYLSYVPHKPDHPVELLEHGLVGIQSKFEEFHWEFICSLTASAFAIDLKDAITSFSLGSTPRARVTGHWGSPSMMCRL